MGALAQRLKQGLVATGDVVPKGPLVKAELVVGYVRYGRWLKDHGYRFPSRVRTREACFDAVARAIGDRPALLMEFGVHRGDSLRYWTEILSHPDTRFLGFDSFEGLPETFSENRSLDRARFDVDGRVPDIGDERVTLHKGWFEDTLDGFVPPEHDQLVLCLDADLYSSTKTVLQHLDKWIVPGTFVYFDELAYIHHEALAFHEYMEDSGKHFTPFIGEWSLNRCVFRCR